MCLKRSKYRAVQQGLATRAGMVTILNKRACEGGKERVRGHAAHPDL